MSNSSHLHLTYVDYFDGLMMMRQHLACIEFINEYQQRRPMPKALAPSFDAKNKLFATTLTSAMPRYNTETNTKVDRSAAERLQEKLYIAAETALDDAISSGTVPAALLSATQSILRDAGLNPDLSTGGPEGSTEGSGASANWLAELSQELGL
ncbi:hypothetical protein OAK87_00630 [bacterium]|nr:hypothetical protein [bacterium]